MAEGKNIMVMVELGWYQRDAHLAIETMGEFQAGSFSPVKGIGLSLWQKWEEWTLCIP